MDMLVAVGASTAYFYNIYEMMMWLIYRTCRPCLCFEVSAILIALILLDKYLEAHTKPQTTSALNESLDLQAKETRIIKENKKIMPPLDRVKIGGTLLVKPGEKAPVDDKVTRSDTFINESVLTGESIPVEKGSDGSMIGPTTNKNGSIIIETTQVGGDTALSHIIKAVEDAQNSKTPIQRLVNIIPGYFAPIVVNIVIITFIVRVIFVHPEQFEPALVSTVSALAIVCPCTLGLTTSTSIMVGIGHAVESNILFGGDQFVECTHYVDTIVLDKTGTITNDQPVVADYAGDSDTS